MSPFSTYVTSPATIRALSLLRRAGAKEMGKGKLLGAAYAWEAVRGAGHGVKTQARCGIITCHVCAACTARGAHPAVLKALSACLRQLCCIRRRVWHCWEAVRGAAPKPTRRAAPWPSPADTLGCCGAALSDGCQ